MWQLPAAATCVDAKGSAVYARTPPVGACVCVRTRMWCGTRVPRALSRKCVLRTENVSTFPPQHFLAFSSSENACGNVFVCKALWASE